MKPYWQDTLGSRALPSEKLEKRSDANADTKDADNWILKLLGQASSATGIAITPLRIMGIATVFACVRVMSKTMASLPLILYKGDGEGGRKPAIDDPLYSLLKDAPNLEMPSFPFMAMMQGHLSLRQNAYAEIMRDGDGDVAGFYPIDPCDLWPYRDTDLKIKYRYGRGAKVFDAKDILHLRGYSRSGLVGVDLSSGLQEVFALAIALQENASKFFGNGSLPNIILSHPQTLSSEAQQRLKDQFEKDAGGARKYRATVVEEGLVASVVRSENKDSQFDESRANQDLQICRVFGVPPHKVGITGGMPRANVEEENIAFVSDTIRAECMNWESTINAHVLTDEQRGQGYCVEFDLDALMRGNIKERYEAWQIGRNGGWMNANEIRRKEKMNPIGAIGDIFLQPVNYVALGTPPAPVAAPAGPGDKGGDPTKGAPAAPVKPAPAPKAELAPLDDPSALVIPILQAKPAHLARPGDINFPVIN